VESLGLRRQRGDHPPLLAWIQGLRAVLSFRWKGGKVENSGSLIYCPSRVVSVIRGVRGRAVGEPHALGLRAGCEAMRSHTFHGGKSRTAASDSVAVILAVSARAGWLRAVVSFLWKRGKVEFSVRRRDTGYGRGNGLGSRNALAQVQEGQTRTAGRFMIALQPGRQDLGNHPKRTGSGGIELRPCWRWRADGSGHMEPRAGTRRTPLNLAKHEAIKSCPTLL
jgi:hypothetical protein